MYLRLPTLTLIASTCVCAGSYCIVENVITYPASVYTEVISESQAFVLEILFLESVIYYK